MVKRGVEPRMQVKQSGVLKSRKIFVFSGLGNGVRFGVHNNSLANLYRGLMERVYNVEKDGVLVKPPAPLPDVFQRLGRFRRELLSTVPIVHRMATEQFVEHYDGRRRTVYEKAAASLETQEISRKDSFLETFVKAEKINFTSKPDPAPRVIQPRTPRYNVCVGRYIMAIEKLLYRGIANVWGGPTVMKGYNAVETATHVRQMWDEFHFPVAVGLDASRFDQHVSVDALKWEHSVYLRCFPEYERAELSKLLAWQRTNKGFGRASDGSIKYQVDGCRMSGDMNTALGNCLLMSAMVHELVHTRGIRARLANNGDDCVVIMERADLAKFMAGLDGFFLDFGFTMKVETPVYIFESIEFCQCHPVWNGVSWIMVRDPRVTVAKDAVSVLPLDQGLGSLAHLTNVGECGLALATGVPVIQEYYNAMIRGGQGVRDKSHKMDQQTGFVRMSAGLDARQRVITDETRFSFWLAFGILPDEQEATEQMLLGWTFEFGRPRENGDSLSHTVLLAKNFLSFTS